MVLAFTEASTAGGRYVVRSFCCPDRVSTEAGIDGGQSGE